MSSLVLPPTRQLIFAHRGNSGNPLNSRHIENTIDSFQSAWEEGADGIELDVHRANDGELVVYHDDYLGRVFSIPGDDNKRLVCEYSSTELDRANLSPGIQTFPGARIPKLEELLPIPKGKTICLELKFVRDDEFLKDATQKDTDYLDALVKSIVEFIESNNLQDQVNVLSFLPDALRKVKERNSGITTAYNVYKHEAEQPNSADIIKALKSQYGFDIINPPFEQVIDGLVDIIHTQGLRTYPWVWNQTAEEEVSKTEELLKKGVDGTINNSVREGIEIRNRLSTKA